MTSVNGSNCANDANNTKCRYLHIFASFAQFSSLALEIVKTLIITFLCRGNNYMSHKDVI